MPTYGYLCPSCGQEMEDFALIKDRKETMPCTKCSTDSPRHFGGSTVGHKDNPSQIKEAMRAFPGSRYDASGALLIANRAEKKLRMKQRGYTEY